MYSTTANYLHCKIHLPKECLKGFGKLFSSTTENLQSFLSWAERQNTFLAEPNIFSGQLRIYYFLNLVR